MNIQEKLKKILTKASNLEKGKDLAYAQEFISLDEKIDEKFNSVQESVAEISVELKKKLEEELSYEVDEQKIVESVLSKVEIPEPIHGKDGENYTLTENDKKEIAKSIKVPVVEKIIERTEVIKEQPIITNEIKEVAITDTGSEIVAKINELRTDEDTLLIDASHIKGLEIGRGVVRRLSLMADVSIPSPTDGQVLTYNSTTNRWEAETPSGVGGSGWELTGNAGTTAGTNFVGTTDDVDLVFKRNSIEALRIPTGSTAADTLLKVAGSTSFQLLDNAGATFLQLTGTDLNLIRGGGASQITVGATNIDLIPDTAVNIGSAKELRFMSGANYVGFKPGTLAGNTIWTLPTTDSTGTQALVSDGSGNLSWASTGGGGTPGGSDKQIQYNNAGAFAGGVDYDKVVYMSSDGYIYSPNYPLGSANITFNSRDGGFLMGDVGGVGDNMILDVGNTPGQVVFGNYSGTNIFIDDGTGQFIFATLVGGVTDNVVSMNVRGVAIKAGESSGMIARVGGKIDSDTNKVGNVGTGEDDLITFSVIANTLSANGQSITGRASGTIANSINTKRLKFKYGATTVLNTGAAVIPVSQAIAWTLDFEIIRTSATSQKCNATLTTDNTTFPTFVGYSTAAETLSGAVTLKMTGEATSNNDIVQETLTVYWQPQP